MNWKSRKYPEASYSYTNEVDGKVTIMGNERMNARTHTPLCDRHRDKVNGKRDREGTKHDCYSNNHGHDPHPTPKQWIRWQEDGYKHAHNQTNNTPRVVSHISHHITCCDMYKCISTHTTTTTTTTSKWFPKECGWTDNKPDWATSNHPRTE